MDICRERHRARWDENSETELRERIAAGEVAPAIAGDGALAGGGPDPRQYPGRADPLRRAAGHAEDRLTRSPNSEMRDDAEGDAWRSPSGDALVGDRHRHFQLGVEP